MNVKTHILAVTDLSVADDKALSRALLLSANGQAKLTIVCVVEDPTVSQEKLTQQVHATIRQKVEQLSMREVPEVVATVASANPVEIITRARGKTADLIVFASEETRPFRELFAMSPKEKIARGLDRPVLIVKKHPRGTYRRVVVAVDFSEHARNALALALQFAPKAQLYLVHAYGRIPKMRLRRAGASERDISHYRSKYAAQSKIEMAHFLREFELGERRLRLLVSQGRPPAVITRLSTSVCADLIAMGTLERRVFPYSLFGGVADEVLRMVPADVMIAEPNSASSSQ